MNEWTKERENEIRGAAETLQWGRDRDAAEMMLDLLAALDAERIRVNALRQIQANADALRAEAGRSIVVANERQRDKDREHSAALTAQIQAAEARTEKAERERDEAQAALVGLREAARSYREVAEHPPGHLDTIQDVARDDLDQALAATPAALAGQVRARALREAAERLDRDAAETCAARRAPEPYRLATTGELFQPTPSCSGYYERGLRCPDCPIEASGADTLRALADEDDRILAETVALDEAYAASARADAAGACDGGEEVDYDERTVRSWRP